MKVDYSQDLNELLAERKGGAYIGGTLCMDEAWFNVNTKTVHVSGDQRKMNDDEFTVACKLYLKHKTPKHAFYGLCLEHIGDN